MSRMTWQEICEHDDLRGRWVAIDDCRYDEVTGAAMEGSVIDVDDDVSELCNRICELELRNCSIVFADINNPAQSLEEDHFVN